MASRGDVSRPPKRPGHVFHIRRRPRGGPVRARLRSGASRGRRSRRRHGDPDPDADRRGRQLDLADHRAGYSGPPVAHSAGRAPGGPWHPRGTERRGGWGDLGLRPGRQFQPHQGPDRWHRGQRSELQRRVRLRSGADRRRRASRGATRSAEQSVRLGRAGRRDQHRDASGPRRASARRDGGGRIVRHLQPERVSERLRKAAELRLQPRSRPRRRHPGDAARPARAGRGAQ